MSRESRRFSSTKVYHIICKGIDGQDIFYNDYDKTVFLDKILETKENIDYTVYAYCLMSNHVHLVLGIQDEYLSKLMKSLSIRYISYFNKKYLRSGPFFQDRFNSKCVENQKYFLDVCRYVHQNPEKAGICKVQDYKWSSYHEYIGKEKIISKNILLHYFNNNIEEFEKFNTNGKSDNEFDFMEYELKKNFKDDELAKFIMDKLNIENINDISKMTKEELYKNLDFLKNMQYTNLSQIARVTRLSRWRLERILKNKKKEPSLL